MENGKSTVFLDPESQARLDQAESEDPGFNASGTVVIIADRETLNGMRAVEKALRHQAIQKAIVSIAEQDVPYAVKDEDVEKVANMIKGLCEFAEAKQS